MKYILITGANGGMGKATVELFVKNGYRVFALDKEECAPRENVIPVRADVTNERSVAAALEAVSAETPELCGISPMISESTLVLPQPEGPTIDKNSPSRTVRFRSCMATVSPSTV